MNFDSHLIADFKFSRAKLRFIAPLIAFVVAYGIILFKNDWNYSLYAGGYTLVLSLGVWIIYQLIHTKVGLRKTLAYLTFFVTSLLTITGNIGVLTGFNRSEGSVSWLGVSFVTAGLAIYIFSGKLSFKNLCLNILQPARFNSGPVSVPLNPLPRLNFVRASTYIGWVILGSFLFCVLAAKLSPFLILRTSVYSLDILAFAFIFEIYVYFNFCGISLIVFGLLNLAGVRTILNFNAPFSAHDVIGYWQRWHISLSTTLKSLFFIPIKKRFGLAISVLLVFASSAMWHGMTLNFLIWGLFHGSAWLLTYFLTKKFVYPGVGRFISLLIYPPIIIFGRLIFSETDPDLLFLKVQNLLNFKWDENAYLLNLTLDTQSAIVILASVLYIGAESLFPHQFNHYKILRKRWILIILLALTLAFGTVGLGGIYGTR